MPRVVAVLLEICCVFLTGFDGLIQTVKENAVKYGRTETWIKYIRMSFGLKLFGNFRPPDCRLQRTNYNKY